MRADPHIREYERSLRVWLYGATPGAIGPSNAQKGNIMNTVTITGNLVAAPELRYTPAGTAVANFAIANNELVKGESVLQGFFDCTAWKAQAENVAALSKGAPVVVTGRLEQSRWENEEGQTRTRIRIVAMTVGASLQFAPRDKAAETDEEPPADVEEAPEL